MTRHYRAGEASHLLALAVWLGALLMGGVVAALVFPAMEALDPQLPDYANYPGPHWRITAGQFAARVFRISDVIQYVCAAVVLAALAGMWWFRPPIFKPPWGRTAFALAAWTLLGYHAFVLEPRMHPNMTGYWAAAKAGDEHAAQMLHAAFDRDHPAATRNLVATAVVILVSLGGSAWSLTGRGSEDGPAQAVGGGA